MLFVLFDYVYFFTQKCVSIGYFYYRPKIRKIFKYYSKGD